MSLGTLGSTLNDELNRLANGGTYRDSAAMVDEALAAKQWANRENISPYSTDTVGVLNEIAGLGLDKKNWLDFNGVCNYIAGTSGLPAAAALRQIYPTTDLLTGVASYYVDAIDASASGQTITNLGTAGSLLPTTVGSSTSADSNDPIFLAHTGTNYVYLPGIASNLLTVPDATGFAVTDLDVRAQVALDDWTPAAIGSIASQYGAAGDRSWTLRILTTGILRIVWSNDGTATLSADSTVAPTVADGATLWVRATLDVDNGASGKDVKFFTSTNGSTWTQLGSTVTTAGTTTIFNSTGVLSIGGEGTTGLGVPLAGKVFRTQLMNAIDGTAVLDVDTSVITTGAATSFTAVTGQTVTINRSTSGRKTVAVTQPTWLFGTDDYMEVNNRYMAHSTAAENYVYLSGASGNYMSAPDNPPLDITTDLDLRCKVALDDWTPGAISVLLNKWSTSGNFSYTFYVATSGSLVLAWSSNGSTSANATSVATGLADGATKWVRATLDVDNGAGGRDIKFFTSDDGTTWTQLGTTITQAGTTSIYSGTANLEIGIQNVTSFPARGKFFRAQVLNGIDGTVVLDADASVITLPSQTTFVDRSSNAYTVTINKSGVGTFVSTGNYLYLPGISGNYASAPDSAAVSVTGDIDLRVKVALDDWTPAADMSLIAKYAGSQHSYILSVMPAGTLRFYWSANGTTDISVTSSVATGIADGSTKWIRCTLDVDNGALGNTTTFFTSDDGITWTQLGTTITNAIVTSIFDGTATQEIGTYQTGTGFISRGKFFRAQVLNGINGTLVFDANFENSITSLLQTSFTESSTNGATVTINRSGSTYRSAGVIDAGYLYPGATNTFSNSTTDFLNFGTTDSFTVLTVNRLWTTPTSSGTLIGKRTTDANWGYVIRTNGTAVNPQSYIVSSGTLVSNTVATTVTAGTLQQIGTIINRGTNTIATFQNGTTATGTSISTVGSVSNVATLQIGALNVGANSPQDFEFIGAAIFRTVLTATQIRQVANYFANREAYL